MAMSDTDEEGLRHHIRFNGVDHSADADGTFVRIQQSDGSSFLEVNLSVRVQGEAGGGPAHANHRSALITIDGIPVPADTTVRSLELTIRLDDDPAAERGAAGESDFDQSAPERQIVTSGTLDLTWSPGRASSPPIGTMEVGGPGHEADLTAGLDTVVPRAGYDAGFTGIDLPEPGLSDAMLRDAVLLNDKFTIPYTHFSLSMSAERRMARYVAWNIDGARMVKLPRTEFALDPRIDAEYQWGNALYSDNVLDRGHIARRADLCWGGLAEAQQANRDSFFYTNIAPQHQAYNQSSRQGLWGELEDHVFAQAGVAGLRLSVQAGPIFGEDDITHRDARIPAAFWKLIAWRGLDDAPRVAAFVLTQEDLLGELTTTLTFEPFHLYQVGLEELAGQTGLDFDGFPDGDLMRHRNRASGSLVASQDTKEGRQLREVRSVRDMLI
jgi:endonuclease G